MNANLIAQLVQIAIALAKTQLDGGSAAAVLLDIIRAGVQAYEDHTGQPLDPQIIKPEAGV